MARAIKRPPSKTSFVWFLILVLFISGYFYNNNDLNGNVENVSFSEFRKDINQENILDSKVTLSGSTITYETSENINKKTFKEPQAALSQILKDNEYQDLDIQIKQEDTFWLEFLISAFPAVLILFFFFFMMKSAQSSNSQALNFGKTKARLSNGTTSKTKFADVAGAKEAKEELKEVVDFLKSPSKYIKMGAKIPKGVILVGPPGTGKTLLARAVSGEAGVPFFSISGSEFVEMFVGVGASRVRDLFKNAKKTAPCIIFIDEIDAVGRQRGTGLGGGHDEREQTLNQILTEMDGFETGANVIVIAATNRPDVLDPALLRPGRFDRRVVVDRPDIKDREAILEVHARKKPLKKNVDLSAIAKRSPGFTGADLENVMNEAAIMSASKNLKKIGQPELENALEKVALGPEKRSRVLSETERNITAHHEVGHAVVGHLMPDCDPVHKLSIISRGQALGITWYLPEEDRHLYSKAKFESELCAMLGGYVTEEIFFGQVTTGPSNDLERATAMARRMVTEFGMTDLGPVTYGEKNHEVFIGRDIGHSKNYSEKTAYEIDQRVSSLINEAYKKTVKIVKDNKALISKISLDLLKKENIGREEFESYFK